MLKGTPRAPIIQWFCGILFYHQSCKHWVWIKEDLKVNDFQIFVDFCYSRSDKFHELSSRQIVAVGARPMGPMSPSKRHFRGAFIKSNLSFIFGSVAEKKRQTSFYLNGALKVPKQIHRGRCF